MFIPKFHCEVNAIEMYQGYLKGRYRQVKKMSFDHAKKEVVIALDSCSINTMRRYYNRALRFIDAYRKGLSVKAAAWCVKKQRRHRTISEEAMQVFEDQVGGQVDCFSNLEYYLGIGHVIMYVTFLKYFRNFCPEILNSKKWPVRGLLNLLITTYYY